MTERHFMIDLETLSTSARPVFHEIGVVEFDTNTFKTTRQAYLPIKIDSFHGKDCTIDADTILWHLDDPQRCRNLIHGLELGESLRHTMHTLTQFLMYSGDPIIVWANPARFDIAILEQTYHMLGIKRPWNYNSSRCLMTLRKLYPFIEDGIAEADHVALNDCARQIEMLRRFNTEMGIKIA